MNETKITLSQKERQLVTNTDWILTKNGIIQKVKQLFEQLQAKQFELLVSKKQALPPGIFLYTPKISKGENYKGLPYLILDQPRVFEKDNLPDRQADILAIRTMFWWGNFFSITLHLSGLYKKNFEETVLSAYPFLIEKDFFSCINPGQWEHHFEASNYTEIGKMSASEFETGIRASSFVKIAKKIPLEDWDSAEESLLGYFRALIGLLS